MAVRKGMFGKPSKSLLLSRVNISEDEPYTAIVTGVQRGGTSMVAGVIRELGLDMGPTGLNHEDVNFLSLDTQALGDYIAKRNIELPRWGFKLPGVHANSNILSQNIRNPIWIFVFRNVVSNIDSLLIHGEKEITSAFVRIINYYQSMMPILRSPDSHYVMISYDRSVNSAGAFCRDLANVLKLSASPDQLDAAKQQILGEGGGYIPQKELYHHIETLSPGADVGFSSKTHELARCRELVGPSFIVSYKDITPPREMVYCIERSSDKLKAVSVIFDFGGGFVGLAKYEIPLLDGTTYIKITHEGGVSGIGFGQMNALLSQDLKVFGI